MATPVRKLFHTVERISPKQSLTQEGYLLCEGVPIARTGEMIYGGSELEGADGKPVVTPNDDGLVRIARDENEVFRAETIASFNGKSVSDDHPEDGSIGPVTWQERTVGIVLNPRRGEGEQHDLLLADLLITVPSAIEAVRSGKREVSCGYEADYEEIGVGEGRQKNIIGNHVALVESGRCGWRCAIGDRKLEEKQMSKKLSWLDRAKAAFHSKDEEGFNKALEEAKTGDDELGMPENEQHIHVHLNSNGQTEPIVPAADENDPDVNNNDDDELATHIAQNAAEHEAFAARLTAIEKQLGIGATDEIGSEEEVEDALAIEAPVGTGDKARKSTDSAYMAESFKGTVALAEILAPGIGIPTFDFAANPKKTFKDVCSLRRQALDAAYAQPSTRSMIEDIMGNKTIDFKKMSCDAVRQVFVAAGSIKRASNNDASRGKGALDTQTQTVTKPTLKDMNRLADAKWLTKVN
jgi:uncharacterized protein